MSEEKDSMTDKTRDTEKLNDELDKIKACIHCGICLSACPTYLSTGNEGNSPRGRLYLIKDLINGTAEQLDSTGLEYLDNCLSCMACETVCPSGVEYIELLDYARHERKEIAYTKGLWGLLRKFSFKYILDRRALMNYFRLGINFLNNFYKFMPFLPKFNKIQPTRKLSYQRIETNKLYRSNEEIIEKTDAERTVIFNLGCVMDTLYNQVHHDTIKVLNAAGYHVFIAESQCCGALASHSGEFSIGEEQTNNFIQSQCDALNSLFKEENALSDFTNPIVFNSAGCAAHIKDKMFAESLIIRDIAELLNPLDWKAPLPLDKFKEKITNLYASADKVNAVYHPACHMYHAQGLTYQYQALLALIPNINLIPFLEAEVCCGSAGFYNLIKPKLAEAIGMRKAENISRALSTKGVKSLVITANPGCMSQIEAHLEGAYTVMHPLSVLAGCL